MGACNAGCDKDGFVTIDIEPPFCALVWLHGLGDTERRWAQKITDEMLWLIHSECGYCKLVTPRAPVAPVTCNGGRRMTCWFDMLELPLSAGHSSPTFGCDLESAKASVRKIHAIIDGLLDMGIPTDKIAVGGFSQGGAVAMLAALGYPAPLAGCVAFSGLLLGKDELPGLIHPQNQGMQLLWCHGEHDVVLLPSLQRVGCKALESAGVRVKSSRYSMGHTSHPAELAEGAVFLSDCFNGKGRASLGDTDNQSTASSATAEEVANEAPTPKADQRGLCCLCRPMSGASCPLPGQYAQQIP